MTYYEWCQIYMYRCQMAAAHLPATRTYETTHGLATAAMAQMIADHGQCPTGR